MAQYKMHTAVKRENASRYDVVCIFLGPESDRVVAADSVKTYRRNIYSGSCDKFQSRKRI